MCMSSNEWSLQTYFPWALCVVVLNDVSAKVSYIWMYLRSLDIREIQFGE